MLPYRVCCVPTQFPFEPRCTGVQRRPLCTDCCWCHVCWTGVQMVVIAGQPGKQTLSHDDPHTEEKHTRAHTNTRTPIKALARESATSQLVGTEEWHLTCLHCDNEATHRRAFLQARAALAGSEVQQCYSTPPPPSPKHTHLCCRWSLDELLQVRKSARDYLRVPTITHWLSPHCSQMKGFSFLRLY